MARITWLADVLRAAKVEVVEHDGWKTHERPGDWTPRFGIVHATAAPRTQSDATQVRIVRDGRSDLLGPIANACVDRQGRWHVLSAGRCNTTLAGTAGPYEGLGNTYALGVEACNDNGLADPPEEWPDVQYQAYARGWAAICRRLGWEPDRLRGHKEHTPGRKTDPTFSMPNFRELVGYYLEDDMTKDEMLALLKSADGKAALADAVWGDDVDLSENRYSARGAVLDIAGRSNYLANSFAPSLTAAVRTIAAKDAVDEQALAEQLAPAVAAIVLAGLPQTTDAAPASQDDITAAVKAVLRDAFAG